LEAMASREISILHDQSRAERNGATEVETLQRSWSDGKTRGVRGKVAEVERVQDKNLILDNIAFQRAELERSLSKTRAIESEISRLEADSENMSESLNNPRAPKSYCVFAKGCDQCGFYSKRSHEDKGNYGRFKL